MICDQICVLNPLSSAIQDVIYGLMWGYSLFSAYDMTHTKPEREYTFRVEEKFDIISHLVSLIIKIDHILNFYFSLLINYFDYILVK